MKTINELNHLNRSLGSQIFPRALREWDGADVVITSTAAREKPNEDFYPNPRFVLTKFASELSWLFEKLRDAFYSEERIDGCSKIEFFGRLANAANRYLKRTNDPSVHHLIAAVLHEAFSIYDEMEEGSFNCILVAIGNEIKDDYVDDALRTGFIGTESTLAFLKSHGVEVEND